MTQSTVHISKECFGDTIHQCRDTDIRFQLQEAIDDVHVERLLCDPAWGMQEMYQGERMVLLLNLREPPIGTNGKGLEVQLSRELLEFSIDRIPISGRTEIDGVSLGCVFTSFDLIMLNGRDLRNRPYKDRLELLEMLLVQAYDAGARDLPRPHTYRSTSQKQRVYREMREQGARGVVFKRMDAPVTSANATKNGVQLKKTFTDAAI